jgi:hypothetical protein
LGLSPEKRDLFLLHRGEKNFIQIIIKYLYELFDAPHETKKAFYYQQHLKRAKNAADHNIGCP